jgi:lipid-binding SYLF domain-containing protein
VVAWCGRLGAAIVAGALLAGCQSKPEKQSVEEQRAMLLRYADETLARLYAEHPDAKAKVEAAAGYAVFQLYAVNAVMLIGQEGRGVLMNNKTRVPYYMRALRAGTGPGVGYQELRQVFVFANEGSMEIFLVGKEAGGDLSAGFTVGTANLQQSFNPYVTTYQMNDLGFAIQANWGGTAYILDPDLACEGGTCPPLPHSKP